MSDFEQPSDESSPDVMNGADKTLFFIMPMKQPFTRQYEELKHLLENKGWLVDLADDSLDTFEQIANLFYNVQRSDVIVANLTERDASVYFELGLALAYDKALVIIAKDEKESVFNLSPFDPYFYQRDELITVAEEIHKRALQTLVVEEPDEDLPEPEEPEPESEDPEEPVSDVPYPVFVVTTRFPTGQELDLPSNPSTDAVLNKLSPELEKAQRDASSSSQQVAFVTTPEGHIQLGFGNGFGIHMTTKSFTIKWYARLASQNYQVGFYWLGRSLLNTLLYMTRVIQNYTKQQGPLQYVVNLSGLHNKSTFFDEDEFRRFKKATKPVKFSHDAFTCDFGIDPARKSEDFPPAIELFLKKLRTNLSTPVDFHFDISGKTKEIITASDFRREIQMFVMEFYPR